MKWKRLRGGSISIKLDHARKNGEKLINGQDMADDEEVNSLASLCIWHGSERGIAFFAFNKMMYHLITRCCESAGIWKKEIKVVKKSSRLLINSILEFDLTQTKTKTNQQSVVYPHKNNFYGIYILHWVFILQLNLNQKKHCFLTFSKSCLMTVKIQKEIIINPKQQNCGINIIKNLCLFLKIIKVSVLLVILTIVNVYISFFILLIKFVLFV